MHLINLLKVHGNMYYDKIMHGFLFFGIKTSLTFIFMSLLMLQVTWTSPGQSCRPKGGSLKGAPDLGLRPKPKAPQKFWFESHSIEKDRFLEVIAERKQEVCLPGCLGGQPSASEHCSGVMHWRRPVSRASPCSGGWVKVVWELECNLGPPLKGTGEAKMEKV